jgi:histone deacetylase 6
MTPKKQTETPVSSVKTPNKREKLGSNTNTPTTRASSARAALETAALASNSCCGDLNQVELSIEIEDQPTPFAVVPLPFCPHLLEINTNPQKEQIDAHKPCQKCSNGKENWICLTCFECFCSRFVKGHMLEHFNENSHPMCLSFSDMSVWCYVCDSYVHNEMLSNVKQIAYNSKFPSE